MLHLGYQLNVPQKQLTLWNYFVTMTFWQKLFMPLADTIFCKNWPVEPYFSLQLADTITNFEAILAAREEEYKKRFVKCFLNVIYFRHLKNIYSSCVFTVSNFFSQLKHFNLQQFSIISFFLSLFCPKWPWYLPLTLTT